jgi:hypothetical protein
VDVDVYWSQHASDLERQLELSMKDKIDMERIELLKSQLEEAREVRLWLQQSVINS